MSHHTYRILTKGTIHRCLCQFLGQGQETRLFLVLAKVFCHCNMTCIIPETWLRTNHPLHFVLVRIERLDASQRHNPRHKRINIYIFICLKQCICETNCLLVTLMASFTRKSAARSMVLNGIGRLYPPARIER